MTFKGFFRSIGGFLKKGWSLMQASGLTDEIVGIALNWVRVAESKYVDNAEKREYVVSILKARGIPEGVARGAVELAVKILKDELKKIGA